MLQHKYTATRFDTLVNVSKTIGQEIRKRNAALASLSLV